MPPVDETALRQAEDGTASQQLTDRFSDNVGDLLRSAFSESVDEPLPELFLDLLSQLEALTAGSKLDASAGDRLSDAAFKRELTALVPRLRAYARSLCGSADQADDLVQDTLLRAWTARDRFQAGTNMRAWCYIILRNQFFSQRRRLRFRAEWDENLSEQLLSRPASQDRVIELADVQRALMALPVMQREALVLIGAGGFSHEEAAAIADVAVGTIKSRVARARAALEQIINEGQLPSRREAGDGGSRPALEAIMANVDELAGRQALFPSGPSGE